MKMSKRGMSDVITTVLIILLVLAAIVIIWTFVKPAIDRVGNIDNTKCTGLNLRVIKCEYFNGTATTAAKYKVQMKLEGNREEFLIGSKLLADLSNGNRDTYDFPAGDLPSAYGTKNSAELSTTVNNVDKLNVKSTTLLPKIKLSNGEDFTCPEGFGVKVSCNDIGVIENNNPVAKWTIIT